MVAALLDTNILVDVLRKYEPAEQWLRSQRDLAVSHVIWLELMEGSTHKDEQRRAITLLNDFALVEFTTSDLAWATQQLIKHRLSHSVDAFDCLIAAPSYRLQLPLYTRNLKHFAPLLGDLAQQPYT
jgi:predicted nucleic acid-binding protein